MTLKPSVLVSALALALLALPTSSHGQKVATFHPAIFSFGAPNGENPYGALVQGSDGNLYGTTAYGGQNYTGTLFSITPDGSFANLYNFEGFDTPNYNGAYPKATLALGSDGGLYGMTSGGGDFDSGVIFKFVLNGTYTVLNSFGDYFAAPTEAMAGLTLGKDGNFHGTTPLGFTNSTDFNGDGLVFYITPTGALTYFAPVPLPYAPLVQGSDGKFYGTSSTGGHNNANRSGSIFRNSPSSYDETYLYQFSALDGNGHNADGANPRAGLVQGDDGDFYGMTVDGGTSGMGTVFKMTPAGALTTLHHFTGSDGAHPQASLIEVNGEYFGTTYDGGAHNQGTVFEMTPDGFLLTLYSFGTASHDGANPTASVLQASNGRFYGTTYSGGVNGQGTLFEFDFKPVITSATAASGEIGQPFSYQIAATNYPTSYSAQGLPMGLTFNPTTGLISGTPNAAGAVYVYLYATNAAGTGVGGLNLTINNPPPPVITSANTASGAQHNEFRYQITATYHPTGYGAQGLPTGLTVNTATGLISGASTESGTFTVTLSATNAGGTGTATLTLGIAADLRPAIISADSANAVAGRSFKYQIKATNDPKSYGATGLPTGLTFSSTTGVIAGTPKTSGRYMVKLSATNIFGTGGGILTLDVYNATALPAITSATTDSATAGSAYSYQITASNGPKSFGAANLPAGLGVNTSTGVIGGTPTVDAGTYSITISATNPVGTGGATLTLTVRPPVPAITSPATATAYAGVPFSYQITASLNPTSFGAANLPAGLTVNTATGLISGTAAEFHVFDVTLSATNANGTGTGDLTLAFQLPPAPVIISAGSASVYDGVAFSYQITATNYPEGYSAENLPAGLTLDTSTGVISGTTTATGSVDATIYASNYGGTGHATLTLVLSSAPPAPAITSALSATGQTGTAFNYQITATNSPTKYGESGIPAGLTINQATGKISGTPTTAGTYTVTIAAFNAVGSGSAKLTLTVNAAAPKITSSLSASATHGVAFSYQITATNSPTSYGESGIPAGLSIDQTSGKISGTPTKAGTYSVTIAAFNATGSGSAKLTLTVK